MNDWNFEIVEVRDDLVHVRVGRDGRTVDVLGSVSIIARVAYVRGCHVQGDGPLTFGGSELRRLARWLREQLDVDELRVEGALRTSGANPGHTPRPLVFR